MSENRRTAVDALVDRLLGQAYLFDDPGAYEAGVRDTLELLAQETPATPRDALVDRAA